MAQSLGGQVDALVRALRAFEPGEYSGEDCARLVTNFARAEKALAAARVRAATRAAECNEHRKEGFADPSEWLSRRTGTTAREARGQLDTMKRLALCPATRDAVAAGELSLGQADEIARTEAEHALGAATSALNDAHVKLRAAERSRAPSRVLAGPRRVIDDADTTVQKARAEFTRADYLAVIETLREIAPQLRAAAHNLEGSGTAAPRRRR